MHSDYKQPEELTSEKISKRYPNTSQDKKALKRDVAKCRLRQGRDSGDSIFCKMHILNRLQPWQKKMPFQINDNWKMLDDTQWPL